MMRCAAIATLGLALLFVGIHCSASDAEPELSLVVRLQFPKNEKFSSVQDLLARMKAQGARHTTLQTTEDGARASAEILVEPKTPSQRVAGIVNELLEAGIKKISVEVKE